jgi:hypothetical protein
VSVGPPRPANSPCFTSYGLRLRSAWELPSLPVALGRGRPDVTISDDRQGRVAAVEASATLVPGDSTGWFRYGLTPEGWLSLSWRRLFAFAVSSDGRQILGTPLESASESSFETHLLSQVLSCAMLRLGHEPIHASVVSVGGHAVALTADSGFGKSSLAATFVAAGDPLLTDDLLVVAERRGRFVAQPGPRRLKLYPSTARRLLGREPVGAPVNDRTRKMVIQLEEPDVVSEPLELAAIYVLRVPAKTSKATRTTIRTLSARRAFVELTKASFNSLLVDAERLSRQFRLATSLATQVPVRTLSYPKGLAGLPDVRRAILRDLGG